MIVVLLALALLQQPAAAIRGVVVSGDGSGTPVRHALVTLSGASTETMITGDDGAFLFLNMPAGHYRLSASKPGYALSEYGTRPGRDVGVPVALATGQQLTTRLRLSRGAVITGRLISAAGDPVPAVTVTASRIDLSDISGQRALVDVGEAVSNEDGVYRIYGLPEGDFVVTAWPEASKDEVSVSAPTSYPSAVITTDATLIAVRAGEERGGADITLRPSQRAAVRGSVVDLDGRPAAGLDVTLVPSGGSRLTSVEHSGRDSVRTGADGSFTFSAVLSGTYTVTATDNVGVDVSPSPTARPAYWARSEVSADGRDVGGIGLMLRPATPVSGRLVFDGSTSEGSARIGLRDDFGNDVLSQMQDDGTWGVSGLIPGHYTLRALSKAPWRAIAATLGGREVLGTGFDVGSEPIGALTITFTDKSGGAHGMLTDAAGAPAPDFIVVVFPADRALWSSAQTSTRVVPPDTNGEWAVEGLPPGDYRVAAITEWSKFGRITTALLEQLMEASALITIGAGASTAITLRVGG